MSDSRIDRRARIAPRIAVAGAALIAGLWLLTSAFSSADERSFAGPPSFADVVAEVSPAVVDISVKKVLRARPTSGVPEQTPFDDFFERFFGVPGGPGVRVYPDTPRESEALGTGFVIDADGYVATNRHVVEGADEVYVTFEGGEPLAAKVIGMDDRTDLALIKVDATEKLHALEFGDSDRARVGDWVLAIGNPFGLGGTATAGIISARGRDIQSGYYDDFLQIDAPINQGNSGGPVFNAAGQVIGINTAIFSPNGGNVGIGFAIPANQAKSVLAELKDNGTVSRGWLGVQIQGLDAELATNLGLDGTDGALIAEVVADGPAEHAGVKPGDVVTALDGQPVDSPRTLGRLVGEHKAGTRAKLTVYRDGRTHDITVQLGALDASEAVASAGPKSSGGAASPSGLDVEDLTAAQRDALGLDSDVRGAVVVGVESGSPAERQGIEPGDVIVKVNDREVRTASDVREELAASRARDKSALVLLQRGDARRFVALPVA